jgi:hypothetical protein
MTAQDAIGAQQWDTTAHRFEASADPRVRGVVILSGPGTIEGAAAERVLKDKRYIATDWSRIRKPALVVAGDQDAFRVAGYDWHWHAEPYERSPGPKCLLVLRGAAHFLGGIQGLERRDTVDENPARVGMVEQATTAYLTTLLKHGDDAWAGERIRLQNDADVVRSVCK